ncbi:MAG: bile acid:sodium symporter [Bacteroidaceae bacterium]|nr:bile acid:sodium symporter [Bacteroidaceae bacterium]MBP5348029.1 bile acid:sodium symporter [Bacteroidaceae bacterium]MBR4594080.1 bile acid:sodium symporter [Bacteroidaceae bacterium]
MYESLQQLDTLSINFNRTGNWLLLLFMAVVMYGVALGLKPQFFRGVFNRPRSLFIGLVCQWLVLPFVTYLLCVLLHGLIPPLVAMGLILVASCPGGAVSNFMTSYSKGNAELSVLMSTITTLGAPIFTPINYAIWGGLYVKYMDASAGNVLRTLQVPPSQIALTVILIIGVPVLLGLITVKFAPNASAKLKELMRYLSIVVFLGVAAMMISQNIILFKEYIGYIFIIVFIHNLLGFGIGYSAATIGKTPVKDRRAVTLETGIQNSGLGLLLLFNTGIFPPDVAKGGMVFVTAWWGVWHIVSGLILGTVFRFSGFDTLSFSKFIRKK